MCSAWSLLASTLGTWQASFITDNARLRGVVCFWAAPLIRCQGTSLGRYRVLEVQLTLLNEIAYLPYGLELLVSSFRKKGAAVLDKQALVRPHKDRIVNSHGGPVLEKTGSSVSIRHSLLVDSSAPKGHFAWCPTASYLTVPANAGIKGHH